MSTTIRSRFFFICLSLLAAAAALGLVITAARAAAPASAEASLSSGDSVREVSSIVARRAISIPYGIASTAPLLSGGEGVRVSGHGVCLEGSDGYNIRVKVRQQGVPAPAIGFTSGSCTSVEELTWSADAFLPGRHTFEAGEAEVCAFAVIPRDRGGAITSRWCKTVVLAE